MTPDQIPQLLAQIALADPRVRREDHLEQRAQVHMWAGILADVPYDYAVRAAQQHYARSTWPVLPADIATKWAATVRDRMNRDVDQVPPVDPDDSAAYRAELAARRWAVATGQTPPVEQAALTHGPDTAAVQARLKAVGRYVPDTVRDALAPYRPAAAARAAAIRAGLPDAYAVTCPVDTCRAQPGQPCTRPARNDNRHRIAQPHPSRTDAAAREDQAA